MGENAGLPRLAPPHKIPRVRVAAGAADPREPDAVAAAAVGYDRASDGSVRCQGALHPSELAVPVPCRQVAEEGDLCTRDTQCVCVCVCVRVRVRVAFCALQLGAMQLERDVRATVAFLTTATDLAVRDKFARLTQVCTVLSVEEVRRA